MEAKLQDFEASVVQRAIINPRWLPGSNSTFWYQKQIESDKFCFMLANCGTGLHCPAFEHTRLAEELGKYADEQIKPYSLPFLWINLDADASWVRFQYNGKVWQYTRDRKLTEWRGVFDTGNFDLGCEEIASPWSRLSATTKFSNYTGSRIDCYWISNDGVPEFNVAVQPGQSKIIDSYIGHRWRLMIPGSENRVVCELKERRSHASIEESPVGLALRWETDQLIQNSGSHDYLNASNSYNGNGLQPFIRNCNLWAQNPDQTERQISHDGVTDNAFKDIYVSPDGRYAVALQCKPPSKSRLYLTHSSPKDNFAPKLISEGYLRAGDNVERKRPRLFNLISGTEIFIDDALFQNPYALTHIGWSDDSQKYHFIFNERGHQHLRLLEISTDGAVKVIVEESSKTFIDYNQKLYYTLLPQTNELLWASERDGWNHLYLFNLSDGTLKNQVTKGTWVMRSVERVDEERRQIWFEGLRMVPGQDPYYAHLACVAFDGTELRVVTEGDGTHLSRVDCLPQTAVRAAGTGREVMLLHTQLLRPALDMHWNPPERFDAPGRNGKTSIYGIIVHPSHFDKTQKYPVIEYIYAGPQGFCTPKAFKELGRLRRVADQGYIVVCADGMGTNWRSKSFHDVCYKNLKDGGFADRIKWIQPAARSRPWMDLSRVGCYGSSAGGQNAAAAVLHHSNFYKAAVAMSGCHDNRMGRLLWNEMWMGYPVDASYDESSNITHAHALGAALMLVVGELDNNVDPATTLRLAAALIKADKDFELVFVPGGTHYVDEMPFVQRKQDEFFRKHLQSC